MKTRAQIKARAKKAISNQRGTAILLYFMFFLMALVPWVIGGIVYLTLGSIAFRIFYYTGYFILLVMAVNMFGEYIKIYKGKPAKVGVLFSGLGTRFFRKLGCWFWYAIWVILWSLLLIIPGIIKTLSYHSIFYIIAEYPNVTVRQAMKLSMKITAGNKGKIFMFGLSWIGWSILSILTLGFLFTFYVGPYMYTADSGLYLEMKREALRDGRITKADLGLGKDV